MILKIVVTWPPRKIRQTMRWIRSAPVCCSMRHAGVISVSPQTVWAWMSEMCFIYWSPTLDTHVWGQMSQTSKRECGALPTQSGNKLFATKNALYSRKIRLEKYSTRYHVFIKQYRKKASLSGSMRSENFEF